MSTSVTKCSSRKLASGSGLTFLSSASLQPGVWGKPLVRVQQSGFFSARQQGRDGFGHRGGSFVDLKERVKNTLNRMHKRV